MAAGAWIAALLFGAARLSTGSVGRRCAGRGDALEVLGLVIFVPAASLYIWCVALFFYRGRGTPLPFAPPTEFVAQGPYRYSRNPMALSVICGAAGFSLYMRSALGLVLSGCLALVLHLYITRREEPELVRRFAEPYVAYCTEVPRWLPGTRPQEIAA